MVSLKANTLVSICHIPIARVTILMLYAIIKKNGSSLNIITDILNKFIL